MDFRSWIFPSTAVELPLRLHANFANWFPTHSLFEDRQHKKLSVKVSIFGTHAPSMAGWESSEPGQLQATNYFTESIFVGFVLWRAYEYWLVGVFHIQFRIYRPLCWLKLCLSQPTTGWRVVWQFIGKRFLATSAYIGRRVACRPSLVRRHYSQPCTDRRLIEASQLAPATEWAPRRSVPMISRIRSVGEKKCWKVSLNVPVRGNIFSSQTFLVQKIDGTGFPDALHSRVTAPPFLAVIWPLDGTARTLGGTVN